MDNTQLEYVNHFSLKKLAKGVASVVKDTVKMAAAPVALAVNSVTGKPTDMGYETGIGKAVGGIHDQSTKLLTGTVKRVGDTITLGYATKAANLIRSEENKEKVGEYHELTNPSLTGIKALDKLSAKVTPVTQVAGQVAGAYTLASGVKTAAGKLGVSPNLLSQGLGKLAGAVGGDSLLDKMKNGDETIPAPDFTQDNKLLGGIFDGPGIWLVLAGLLVLMVVGSSKKSSTNYRRKR